jgi:hypothetical protein
MSDLNQEATNRAAALIAEAIAALQTTENGLIRDELREARAAIESLTARLERHMAEEREHRDVLAGQLGGLVSSLDRLVTQLQALSGVMADVLESTAGERGATPQASEPTFMPGGEGVSLALSGVPGFQALMELQKALARMPALEGASVERYQEGDSRLLLHLRAAVTASEIVEAMHAATSYNIAVEESRPELRSLRLRIV